MIALVGLFLFSSAARAAAPIPFAEAIRIMLARDTEVTAVAAEADAAGDQALGKRYHFLPSLSFEGTETWAKDADRTSSLLGVASVSLFRFGADWLASDAADDHARAVRARFEKTRLDRETQAIDAYLELVRTTETRQVLVALEAMGMDSVKVAQGQFASGRIANQEVQKVKIDLEDTRFQKAEAEQAWIDARARVEALLGTPDVVPEFPWKDRIAATHAPAVDPDEVLRLRPEWIEAERESRAADAAARSAFRGLLPELTARLTYGWETTPLSSVDSAGLVTTWNSGWTGALTVTIPLWNGLRDYAGYRTLSDTSRATEARMEGIKRDVLAETRAVPSRFEIARKTALDREGILRTSKRLYQDNLSRFRQGRASSDELNVDLNRYLKTQLGAISGWVAAHQAYVSLRHLSGACATDCGGRR